MLLVFVVFSSFQIKAKPDNVSNSTISISLTSQLSNWLMTKCKHDLANVEVFGLNHLDSLSQQHFVKFDYKQTPFRQ